MPEPVSERFVGRRAELREISARAASAASGRRQTVVIEGWPGMGKTTLLLRALGQLADFRRLRADCALGSASDQLIAEADQAYHVPPGPRSRGLLATVGALLDGQGPLAVALDNAQLMDAESAAEFSALLAALRTAELLIVVAVRDPWRPDPGDGPHLERLRLQLLTGADVSRLTLGELSVAETAQLLDFTGSESSEQAATRLHRYTGGHPALLSVLLDQGLTAVHAAPADLLGLFDPLVMNILRAVSALPEPSRDLLAAMAVSGERWPIAIAGSVARVEDPFEALEPLLDAGLVEWFPDEPVAPVAIRYPLYRDVIYRSLPAARRDVLHSRAARFELGTRAWAHRVAAKGTADPAMAGTLEQEATSYYLAGDNEQAGRLIMWSTAAVSEPRERERHLAQAAHWWLTLRAVDWGPRLEASLSGWPPSAPRSLILGLLAEAAGRYGQARAQLAEAENLARADGSWPVMRPDIDLATALVSADLGQADAEYRLAEGLLAMEGLPAAHRGWAEYFAADAWGRMNGPEAAVSRLGVLVPDASIDGGGGLPAGRAGSRSVRLWARGMWRVLSGRLREGNEDLARMLRAADRAAADSVVPTAHAYMGYAHYLLGDWKAAREAVAQAVEALDGHGVARLRIPVHAIAACVDAAGGRQEAGARHLQAARRWHAECGPEDYAVFPAIAAATVAQARGDYRQMLAALAPLAAEPGKSGSHRYWWQPLYVEALIGTGQLAAGQDALGRLADLAGAPGQQAPTIAWLAAWLAAAAHENLRARARFEQAAARLPAPDDVPLHRARLEHEYGRFLMSGRNRRAAIARLRLAHELYRSLGAQPFAERAARDLEACGALATAPDGHPGGGPAVLSSRERRIAYLAAQGLTNQEIAGELFVSAKTVEYHLGNVFAKLGISSRRQLPARLGGEPGT